MALKSHKDNLEGKKQDPILESVKKKHKELMKEGNVDVDSIRKRPVTLRLSKTTIDELVEIAIKERVSQAEVIAVLVHSYFMGFNQKSTENYFDLARKL